MLSARGAGTPGMNSESGQPKTEKVISGETKDSVFDVGADYAVLIDFDTGEVLFQKKSDEIMAPSSSTKIMTTYLIFDMLEEKKFSLSDKFKVSIRAWRQDGTRMFLEPEWKVTVDDLIMGTLAISGNDAAIVLAEGSLGTIADFVEKMNEKAKILNLANTHFSNPNGLYEKTHYMSAHDLAILAQSLIKNHKKYYDKYFSQQSFTYNNITQKNRNLLLSEYGGVDGIKTGHTDQGKYMIVTSAVKNGKRLIAVVGHAQTDRSAMDDAKALLDYGFSQYVYLDLYKRGNIVKIIDTFLSKNNKVQVYANRDIGYAIKKPNVSNIKVRLVHDKYIFKPIRIGEVVAQLVIEDGDIVSRYNLYAKNSTRELSGFRKFVNLMKYNCRKLISISFSKNETS